MITVERIVTSYLLKRRLTVHWYLEVLKHATDCLRELHFDVTGCVNADVFQLTDHNTFELPCGFVDYIKVGIPNGQFIKPLVQRSGLSRLNAYNEAGEPVKHDCVDEDRVVGSWLMDSYIPGHTDSDIADTFKVIRERNEIQIDERLQATHAYMEWITDGQEASNATKVDPYAQACIEAYIDWQLKVTAGARDANNDERRFKAEEVKLRGRKNPMTVDDIKRSFRRAPNLKK